MTQCVIPTDYLSYLLAADPVTSTTQNCSELGFEFVSADPIFSKFDLYWKGGAAGIAAWSKTFTLGHPDLMKFLSGARDKQPACSDQSTHPIHPALTSDLALDEPLTHSEDEMMTAYDESGTLAQCAEGPAAYMSNCTFPNDMASRHDHQFTHV